MRNPPDVEIPPKTKRDSYWINKPTMDNAEEIKEWAFHDFYNFNNYSYEKYAAWLRACNKFHKDFIMHSPGPEVHGVDEYADYLGMYFNAFSNIHVALHEYNQFGDSETGYKACHRFTLTGKNTGEFMGQPPTNVDFSMTMMEIDHYKDGKFYECWAVADTLQLVLQLGIGVDTAETSTEKKK